MANGSIFEWASIALQDSTRNSKNNTPLCYETNRMHPGLGEGQDVHKRPAMTSFNPGHFLKLLHCTTHYHTSCKGEMMKSHITKSPCEVDAGEVKVRAACLLFLVRLTFPPAIILGVKNKG